MVRIIYHIDYIALPRNRDHQRGLIFLATISDTPKNDKIKVAHFFTIFYSHL